MPTYEAARDFMLTSARPVERALFSHRFEAGSTDDVVAALAAFQNADGGYGHGLEADHHTPTSSTLSTNMGLEYLAHADASSVAAQPAIAFLVDSFDPRIEAWPIVPADTPDYPHAPWWADRSPSDGHQINPRFETLAHLVAHRDVVSPRFDLDRVMSRAIAGLPAVDDTVEPHEALCVTRLAETPGIRDDERAAMTRRLEGWLPRVVETDPDKWGGYCLKPLDVVRSPESPWLDGFADVLPAALDYEIARQADHGAWEPHWTWFGDRFPEAWAEAKVAWSGILTYRILTWLAAFERLG